MNGLRRIIYVLNWIHFIVLLCPISSPILVNVNGQISHALYLGVLSTHGGGGLGCLIIKQIICWVVTRGSNKIKHLVKSLICWLMSR